MSQNGEADWLTDLGAPQTATPEQKNQAREFAQLYRVFVDDPRGRALLEHWTKTIVNRRLAPPFRDGRLEFAEGERKFVLGIHEQLELAQQG